MSDYGVNMYSVYSKIKSSLSERLIRSLKNRLYIEMDLNGNRTWIKYIEKVTDEYNNTVHSKIKMRPIDVGRHNEKQIFESIYNLDRLERYKYRKPPKFKLNDLVRISKNRSHFHKSYLVNYSYEIFKIKKILWTNPIMYMLEDYNQKPIVGAFYEYELKKSRYPNLYLVEKILAKKKGKVKVRYFGFPPSEDQWIDEKDLL